MFTSRVGRRVPYRRPLNNFGDLLGPVIVEGMLDEVGLCPSGPPFDRRLLTVGSVLALANTGDTVWGSGLNGKIDAADHRFTALDVRAVRGPRTRQFLTERGIDVPEVYGDPALLLPRLMPRLTRWAQTKQYRVTVVPNFNDLRHYPRSPDVLDPRRPLEQCLRRIAQSELVVGSSLHALVVAEALGIPARMVTSRVEAETKYADYYEGTGRPGFQAATSVSEAIALGGEQPLDWSPDPLVGAFPYDLWGRAT